MLLRIASYNIRVDHTDDLGTIHEWSKRRKHAASTVIGLRADLTCVQEPSRVQAKHLENDLGDEYGVKISSCDPKAWSDATSSNGPDKGQARDGNGFIWLRSRLELIGSVKTFWLCETPDVPCSGSWAWNGSPYQRTCAYARFRDRRTGQVLCAFSCHFDHEGDDVFGGSLAREKSASLVMRRARSVLRERTADVVIVAGDFNTFRDRDGACYEALVNAAGSDLRDVRCYPGETEFDCGRASSSWEGWPSSSWSRKRKGGQRYDQFFVSSKFQLLRTAVHEDSFLQSDGSRAYASDHLPILADGFITCHRKKKNTASWLSPGDLMRFSVALLVCALIWKRSTTNSS